MTAITIQGPILALDPPPAAPCCNPSSTACRSSPPPPTPNEPPSARPPSPSSPGCPRPTRWRRCSPSRSSPPSSPRANAYRCAAWPRSAAGHASQRYQSKAATLSRLTSSKRRELLRLQASQPAGVGAARETQARATASAASARPAAPAPQPKAAAQRPVTPAQAAAPPGRAAGLDHATIDQHLAKAAAASHPAHDDLAPPTGADLAQIVTDAHALLAEVTPPARDTGARLQAELAARAAATTQLAA